MSSVRSGPKPAVSGGLSTRRRRETSVGRELGSRGGSGLLARNVVGSASNLPSASHPVAGLPGLTPNTSVAAANVAGGNAVRVRGTNVHVAAVSHELSGHPGSLNMWETHLGLSGDGSSRPGGSNAFDPSAPSAGPGHSPALFGGHEGLHGESGVQRPGSGRCQRESLVQPHSF